MCLDNHYIIIYSDYSCGKRIGYHIQDTENKTQEVIKVINKLKKENSKLNFGLHFLQTEAETWASVIESDSFFKDIYITSSLKELKNLIKKSVIINNNDIFKIYEWSKLKKEENNKIDKENIIDYSINSSSFFKDKQNINIIFNKIYKVIEKKDKNNNDTFEINKYDKLKKEKINKISEEKNFPSSNLFFEDKPNINDLSNKIYKVIEKNNKLNKL